MSNNDYERREHGAVDELSLEEQIHEYYISQAVRQNSCSFNFQNPVTWL